MPISGRGQRAYQYNTKQQSRVWQKQLGRGMMRKRRRSDIISMGGMAVWPSYAQCPKGGNGGDRQSCKLTCQNTHTHPRAIIFCQGPGKFYRNGEAKYNKPGHAEVRKWQIEPGTSLRLSHTHTEHEAKQWQKDVRPHTIMPGFCFLWPTFTTLEELRVSCRRILVTDKQTLSPRSLRFCVPCGFPSAE